MTKLMKIKPVILARIYFDKYLNLPKLNTLFMLDQYASHNITFKLFALLDCLSILREFSVRSV